MPDQNLLVVEDDLVLRSALAEFFENRGFGTYLASNEADAFEIAVAKHPDVIISDQFLETGSGLSLIQHVKSCIDIHSEDKPYCILITGQGNAETSVEAVQMKVDDFLVKPLDLNHLIAAVSEGLLRRQRKDEGRGGQALNAFYHNMAAPMVVLHAYLDMFHEGRFGGLSEIQKTKMALARDHLLRMMGFLSAFRRNEQLDVLEREKKVCAVADLMQQAYGTFALDFERRGVNVFLEFAPKESKVWTAVDMAEKVLQGLCGYWLLKAPVGATLRIRWQMGKGVNSVLFQLDATLPPTHDDNLAFDGALLQKAGLDLRSLEKGMGHQLFFLHPV